MATEVVRWCDVHMETDERVPGGAHSVQVDGRSGTVDLCPDHAKVLLGPLMDILAPVAAAGGTGRAGVGGRKAIEGPALCFLCPARLRPDRMGPHLRLRHQTSLDDVYGATCPVCGETLASSMGVSTHARAHGRTSLVDLWVAAEEAGDPDGVVAARRALVQTSRQ